MGQGQIYVETMQDYCMRGYVRSDERSSSQTSLVGRILDPALVHYHLMYYSDWRDFITSRKHVWCWLVRATHSLFLFPQVLRVLEYSHTFPRLQSPLLIAMAHCSEAFGQGVPLDRLDGSPSEGFTEIDDLEDDMEDRLSCVSNSNPIDVTVETPPSLPPQVVQMENTAAMESWVSMRAMIDPGRISL
jgi:hypothetical protein